MRDEGEALKETGPVSGEFCSDAWSDKGQMGLLDESIKHAQKQSGVDFITNVAFFSTGKCILLEGTGQKVVLAAVNPSAPTSVEPASKPANKKKRH